MATLLIENRGRDQKDLGPIIVDGSKHNLHLGSSDDARGAPVLKDADGTTTPGQPGVFSDEFPNPVQPIDAKVWAAYLKDPTRGIVITAWLNNAEISVSGALGRK